MRIKANQTLYVINALALVLILIIVLLPDNVLRIVLGLPLVLFFPGYVLLSALFHRRSSLDDIERFAFSLVLSIAIVPIIGLILNYTSWGITVFSVLVSLSIFIFSISIIAWFRQRTLPDEEKSLINIDLTSWRKRNALSKAISIILVTVIIGTVGVLIYTIATPKVTEKFTEFYVLGLDGKATDYPTELKLDETSYVILGIVNREQEVTTYNVEIKIDEILNETFGPITLEPDEKLESEVSFTPRIEGDNQKVEFFLYKTGQSEPYLNLHLWINVR